MAEDKANVMGGGSGPKGIPTEITIRKTTWRGVLVRHAFSAFKFVAIPYLCLCAVRVIFGSRPEIDDSRKDVARMGVSNMIADVCKHTDSASRPKKIAVVHFANDPSDFVTDTVRDVAGGQGSFQVAQASWSDRIRQVIGRVNDGVSTREHAIRETEGEGLDGVLWGRVNKLENDQDGATFACDYELYDLRHARPAYNGVVKQSSAGGPVSFEFFASGVSWHIRFLVFVLVALLLPIVTISFIRTMVAKKSNKANAFVLCIYTVIDLIFAYFMVGCSLSSFFPVAVFLLAGILAFLYNVKVMTFAVRLEG